MLNVDSASVYTDFNGLAKLKQSAREQSPEAIKEVAKQFESVFLSMVMKGMRQAKLADGILDSQQSQFYRDMYDQQMAVHLAGKPGIGFADLIAKQLSPKQNDDEKDNSLNTNDFLNRAAGTGASSNVNNPQSVHTGEDAAAAEQKPLDASGLSSLERSLARLERSQQITAGQWQTLEDNLQNVDNQPLNSKEDFIRELSPHAQQAAQALGVDANMLLAQAALETGWGQAVVKNGQGENSYNLFNIKADKSWQGKQAKSMTVEFDGGVAKKEMAGFRAYDSYKASFDDYVNFIKTNPRYSEALKKSGNAGQYLHELQQAGYATDPRYAEKVMTIYRSQTAERMAALKSTG
jgi:flagellar protein FlgJ